LGKIILLAVLPINEPEISNLALGPKIIPLGLIKKRLAFPNTPNVPNKREGLFPITRLKMV
jgi:hypothetical protein